jgi:hypothetical protein
MMSSPSIDDVVNESAPRRSNELEFNEAKKRVRARADSWVE